MSFAAAFLPYVWHYLVARMIYDQLIHPLTHGHLPGAVVIVGVAAAAFALGRLTRRRA